MAARETRLRSRHKRLGGLILALTDEPASTRNWVQGGAGERAVADFVEDRVGDVVVALHDRASRRADGRLSAANIDHLFVAAGAIWVVDAKAHAGRLEVRRSGGLLTARREQLVINGRDRSTLVSGLEGQVQTVTRELATHAGELPVRVRGALCFVGTGLPWGGDAMGEFPLVGRRGLAKLLRKPGPLDTAGRARVADVLATRFPPKTG